MVEVRPFRAITYTPKAGNTETLITQPYDKISLEQQKAYYALSPYNFCRVILPLEEDKYNVANKLLQHWLKEGVMAKETRPAIYVSRQEFHLDGKNYNRTGIIAAMKLYSYNENIVYPHECTYKAPKADRLNMLRTLQKDLEPVFLMYQDPEAQTIRLMEETVKTPPLIQVEDSLGVKHTIWKVSDPEKIRQLQAALSLKAMVINDGHHRYESA
jgi:uncharacterized protein (DUF1015 family)